MSKGITSAMGVESEGMDIRKKTCSYRLVVVVIGCLHSNRSSNDMVESGSGATDAHQSGLMILGGRRCSSWASRGT